MKAVGLKLKGNEGKAIDLVIIEDLVPGLLSGDFYVPVFTDCNLGVRFMLLSNLIVDYKWPEKKEVLQSDIASFYISHNPSAVFETYPDDSIEI